MDSSSLRSGVDDGNQDDNDYVDDNDYDKDYDHCGDDGYEDDL